MGESLKEKLEQALASGFDRVQEEKVRELNKLSRTGKQITRRDYNSRTLADIYQELGLDFPANNSYQSN